MWVCLTHLMTSQTQYTCLNTQTARLGGWVCWSPVQAVQPQDSWDSRWGVKKMSECIYSTIPNSLWLWKPSFVCPLVLCAWCVRIKWSGCYCWRKLFLCELQRSQYTEPSASCTTAVLLPSWVSRHAQAHKHTHAQSTTTLLSNVVCLNHRVVADATKHRHVQFSSEKRERQEQRAENKKIK